MMFDVRSASALRCGVLLGVLSVSLCASPLSAADLDVGSGQSYETISAALQDAADGDRVVVHNGTYEEKIVWIKDVDSASMITTRPRRSVISALPTGPTHRVAAASLRPSTAT